MASYAIIHRHGLRQYVEDTQKAGAAGRSFPICRSKKPANSPKSAARPISVSCSWSLPQTRRAERAFAHRGQLDGILVLRIGHRNHWRKDAIAPEPGGQCRLAWPADLAADLHRLRHRRARPFHGGAGRRRTDRRIRHRAGPALPRPAPPTRNRRQGNRRLRGYPDQRPSVSPARPSRTVRCPSHFSTRWQTEKTK